MDGREVPFLGMTPRTFWMGPWLCWGHSSPVDHGLYAGLMAENSRRGDYVGVSKTTARMPSSALTPKMRAMLAIAAEHRSLLGEALATSS